MLSQNREKPGISAAQARFSPGDGPLWRLEPLLPGEAAFSEKTPVFWILTPSFLKRRRLFRMRPRLFGKDALFLQKTPSFLEKTPSFGNRPRLFRKDAVFLKNRLLSWMNCPRKRTIHR